MTRSAAAIDDRPDKSALGNLARRQRLMARKLQASLPQV